MGFFNFLRNRGIGRGATINEDFIPVDDKGWILHLDWLGHSKDFSNINTHAGQALAYRIVRDIKTVVNKRAEVFQNGKVWVLDSDLNEPNTVEANNTRALLRKPNPLQTWGEFYTEQKVYKYVFGYCPVYKLRPVGISTPKALYNILPLIFSVKYTGKLFQQTELRDIIDSYKISFNGKESLIDLDDVYISKDINPSLSMNCLMPESRLTGLQYDAALIYALGNARYSMVEKRGALGILSNETKDAIGAVTMQPAEKEEIQRAYSNYGITTEKNKVIITDANLKWQQMAMAVKDLQLLELGEDAKIQVSDVFGVPAELLGSIKGTTYANKQQAEKDFIQNSILPEAESDSEALTEFLGLRNCHIDIDFSNMPILQEDRKMRADTLKTTTEALDNALDKGIITSFEYRLELSKIIDIDPNKKTDGS